MEEIRRYLIYNFDPFIRFFLLDLMLVFCLFPTILASAAHQKGKKLIITRYGIGGWILYLIFDNVKPDWYVSIHGYPTDIISIDTAFACLFHEYLHVPLNILPYFVYGGGTIILFAIAYAIFKKDFTERLLKQLE